jgi:hypothetical protein
MKRYERLSRLREYKVDKHQVDPRGWNIVNAEHKTIGEVRDLIVDVETMTGAYLDVELEAKLFDLHGDPRVLVPVARAERLGNHKHLFVPGLDATRVREMIVERDRAYVEVWDRIWQRQLTADELKQVIDHMRPGEQVRIPVLNEEIVVEWRPLQPDERVAAPAANER